MSASRDLLASLGAGGRLDRLATLAGWPPHGIARQRLFGLTSVLVLHARPGVGRPGADP